ADDLLGEVALDALRTGIPADDDAVRVEHEERVVGHARHEQAELALALAHGLLRHAALGDVARHLGEAFEHAVLVPDRVDDDRGPEAAAILAHPPAFGLIAPLAGGGVEDTRREPLGAVFGRIKPREMMTDDLVGGVALEPLGAGVPVAHHAARVEHIDRIVRDRINQQLKTMIGREVLRAAQRQWAFSGLTILRFPGRHAVPPLSRRRTGQHMTPDLGITTEAEPMRTNANALPSNPATALAFVPSYNLGSGGDPEDEPRKPPRSDR